MDKLRAICRCGIWATTLVWLLGSAGCTRMFYRNQADAEVAAVLSEKDKFPQWKIENMHVYPDARARFADPTKPDRPPMPPDDPAAKILGPNPQRPPHAGIRRVEGTGYLDLLANWDAENRADRAARGDKSNVVDTLRRAADLQKEGDKVEMLPPPRKDELQDLGKRPYLLTADQAVELGLINSREFQTRREDLYLTALPVTRERFAFAAQFHAVGQMVRERAGLGLTGGPNTHGNTYGSNVGMGKLFSTGALLLVSFANQTVVDLTNPVTKSVTSQSNLNLDLIQPLLRGGGKAATLEPLTQVERNLLYEIRDYARFRRLYYQYLVGGVPITGIGQQIGLTTPGSLTASHPLFSTLSAANFARQQIAPFSSGTLNLGFDGAAPATGYLPTILQSAQLQYQYDNVNSLEDVLRLYQAYESGGQVSPLQVGQVELQLLQGRSTVLAAEQSLRDSVDTFKLQLGVPVDTPLELEDGIVRPITDQLSRFNAIIKDYETATKDLDKLFDVGTPDKMRPALEALLKDSALTKGTTTFRKSAPERWESWRKKYADNKAIIDAIAELKAERRKLLDLKDRLEQKDQSLGASDQARLRQLDGELAVGELEFAMRKFEKAPWQKAVNELARRKEYAAHWRDVRNAFVLLIGEASTERFARVAPRWPTPPGIVIDGVDVVASELEPTYETVTQVALDNRLDLMNTRAQVTDAWRQLRVFANGLLGTFNVAYHMDSRTPPGEAKPLAFRPEYTRHQLVMNFDLPLVRLTERNAYRASLIAYQRARRNLQQREDEISFAVRTEVRQLQVIAKNLKIQQKAVELAYQQVESSLETFRAPQVDQGGNAAGNAAALTQQLLNAYANLPRTQTQLLATWINYQIVRQQLLVDLELLPLDARGVWINEFSNPSGSQPTDLQRQPEAGQPQGPRAQFGPI